MGSDAARRGGRVRRARAVDGFVSWTGDQPGGVRIQYLWRFAAGRARSQIAANVNSRRALSTPILAFPQVNASRAAALFIITLLHLEQLGSRHFRFLRRALLIVVIEHNAARIFEYAD